MWIIHIADRYISSDIVCYAISSAMKKVQLTNENLFEIQ